MRWESQCTPAQCASRPVQNHEMHSEQTSARSLSIEHCSMSSAQAWDGRASAKQCKIVYWSAIQCKHFSSAIYCHKMGEEFKVMQSKPAQCNSLVHCHGVWFKPLQCTAMDCSALEVAKVWQSFSPQRNWRTCSAAPPFSQSVMQVLCVEQCASVVINRLSGPQPVKGGRLKFACRLTRPRPSCARKGLACLPTPDLYSASGKSCFDFM